MPSAVAGFVECNCGALLDHWTGLTDSLDLLRAINDKKRQGG